MSREDEAPGQTHLVEIATTLGDEAAARKMVRSAVEERVAACGSWFPIRSAYRWKGGVEEEAEYHVTLKTLPDVADRARAWVRAHHPYEIPMIVRRSGAEAEPDYAAWVEESVAPATSGGRENER